MTGTFELDALLSATTNFPPCGPDLAHDLTFLEFEEVAGGKPERRMGDVVVPGEDAPWPKVVELARGLLLRSKDLRTAVHLTRALTRTEGAPGLAAGLNLIDGLLSRYWEAVYPLLDGDDPTERVNTLARLADAQGLVKDLRDTYLIDSREHGRLQVRDIEIALRRLVPLRSAESGPGKSLNEIHAQIAGALANNGSVPAALRKAREHVLAIQATVADRVGSDRATDLKPLIQSLDSVLEACDASLGSRPDRNAAAVAAAPETLGSAPGALDGEIRSRDQAVQVLDRVCTYLERHEPSNPAPLFIRRAQRLMQKNFVEIVKDLLPDSLSNLEKLAGELENQDK